jgi:hypothetical protein
MQHRAGARGVQGHPTRAWARPPAGPPAPFSNCGACPRTPPLFSPVRSVPAPGTGRARCLVSCNATQSTAAVLTIHDPFATPSPRARLKRGWGVAMGVARQRRKFPPQGIPDPCFAWFK